MNYRQNHNLTTMAAPKGNRNGKQFSHLAIFTVSDLLERKATEAERKQGLDLADYLTRFDFREFVSSKQVLPPYQPPIIQSLVYAIPSKQTNLNEEIIKPETQKFESWEQVIIELENYFTQVKLPTQFVKLNSWTKITDVFLFIQSHFATVKNNKDKATFLPFLNRLQELKQVLSTNLYR